MRINKALQHDYLSLYLSLNWRGTFSQPKINQQKHANAMQNTAALTSPLGGAKLLNSCGIWYHDNHSICSQLYFNEAICDWVTSHEAVSRKKQKQTKNEKNILILWTGCLPEEAVYLQKWKTVKYCSSLQMGRDRFLCSVLHSFYLFRGKVKCWCYCLFGKLEAGETGVLLDVLLAHSFVLYSSSHSGGLASGAIWFSSTLRRYWCLAMQYCICREVGKAPGARRRLETVIILGYADARRLLFSCAVVCVWCVCVCGRASCVSAWQCIWF